MHLLGISSVAFLCKASQQKQTWFKHRALS